MININDLRTHVIQPVLKRLELYSPAAEQLLLATAMAESKLEYLQQVRGPARGIYQMEPATHDDIWRNFLRYKDRLANNVAVCMTAESRIDQLRSNLAYATAMCRVHYFRVPAPLPAAGDALGIARYWKQYYNTNLGKGTVEGFLSKTKSLF